MPRTIGARRWLRAVPAAGDQPRPSRPADAELIEAIRRGDARVSGEIYDRLINVVNRTLYRILGRRTPEDRDLVQATFEQIVLTLSTGRFAGACSLETWASVLATHVGLKALRSRRREAQVIELGVDPERHQARARDDIERELDARTELARIRAHLSDMNPAQATTLFLHDGLGHSLVEIAVMTGASVAAAQSRLVRGRRELARRIERASSLAKEPGP